MATDYNLLGSTEVLEELQEGRTRELLMLLQDKPVPEVQDPLNIQSGLSGNYEQNPEGDYTIGSGNSSQASRPTDNTTAPESTKYGLQINPNEDLSSITATISSQSNGFTTAYILDTGGSVIASKDISTFSSGDTVTFNETLSAGTDYNLVMDSGGAQYTAGYYSTPSFPFTSSLVDITAGIQDGNSTSSFNVYLFVDVTATGITPTFSYVTDQFAAPTTEPADFKAWNAIQARDVTTGGSTSTEPVEFEILDSSDTALNSTRIPKARIADEPFTMRNRVYSEDAGSDGQSDYQIATTGDGGHFGIPILTVVSVKQNGSVLDSANWSFDGDTTVTIDTSNVTIASGDTIDIKYDFDVFDSTLQPRAYLNRESSSETSPSISHFRYEYVI